MASYFAKERKLRAQPGLCSLHRAKWRMNTGLDEDKHSNQKIV
jgi:hypothetical protein